MLSSEGHFSENDPIWRVSSSAEQFAFLIHSVGGDIHIYYVLFNHNDHYFLKQRSDHVKSM